MSVLNPTAFERRINGILLIEPDSLAEMEGTGLTAADFHSAAHGRLFGWLRKRIKAGKTVEPYAVIEALADKADGNKYPSLTEIVGLSDDVSSLFVVQDARVIVEASFRRRAARSLTELLDKMKRSDASASDLLADAERTLGKLSGGVGGESSWMTGDDLAALTWADIVARSKARESGEVIGMPWGVDELDNALPDPVSGEDMAFPPMQPGRMYLIAARPGMGKSSLALQILQATAAAGGAVGLFSLEMEADGVGRKLAALATGLPTGLMRDGLEAEHDLARAHAGCAAMAEWPLFLDTTPGQSIERIASKARRLASRLRHTDTPLSMLMVDYAQLIRSDGDSTTDRLAAVSQGLLELSKELQVPVVALAQLNRQCEQRMDKRPMMSDLRGSGQWEQDAHAILFLYRDAYYNPMSEHTDTEVIIGKWRDHRTGTVRVQWEASTQRFGRLTPRMVSR